MSCASNLFCFSRITEDIFAELIFSELLNKFGANRNDYGVILRD